MRRVVNSVLGSVFASVLGLVITGCVVGAGDPEEAEQLADGVVTAGTTETALTLPVAAAADATVRSGAASTNYGTATSLQADLDGGTRSYVRFDVPDRAFSSATLRLYVTLESQNAADVFAVSSSAWSESTITWNTRPDVDGPLLGSFTSIATGAWVELDVTAAVRRGQPLSLALVPRSNDSAAFGSRERASGKPELVLTDTGTTTPPPPPQVTATTCPDTYTRLVAVSTSSQLAGAFANAQAGDQIRLAAGTYTGPTTLSRSGTAAKPITVCGLPGVWPVMHGNFKLTGGFITIAGLVFEGPNNSQNNVYMAGPHDILFTRNIVRDGDWHAGIAVEDSYNVSITYNLIHDNGLTDIDHGIYYRGQKTTAVTRNTIANNVIVGNAGRGISMHDNGGLAVNHTIVAHNTIAQNGNTGILLALNGGTGSTIANNVVADNSRIYHHKQIRYRGGTGNTIANNIAWSPIAADSGMESMPGNTVTGNVMQDPKFVDADDNFHLLATSPAIGLALTGYATSDIDGKARDSQPDSGAYEY